eukprot:TRINITY_DN11759_c0_g1_i2.p1 TRINITY_DN11759_c0_g1~~TRINITY_DN11759_c0_g1_i2.p1  ORF type:complete len:322 (-),score=26.06 TRINITY_DN11759_c0_g1_i2:132-1097(-)
MSDNSTLPGRVVSIASAVDTSIYFALLVVAVFFFVQLCRSSSSRNWTAQRLFFLMIVIALFARVAFFAAITVLFEKDYYLGLKWHFVWVNFPQLIIFFAATCLLVSLADTHLQSQANKSTGPRLRILFVTANVIFDLLALTLYGLIIYHIIIYDMWEEEYQAVFLYMCVMLIAYTCMNFIVTGSMMYFGGQVSAYLVKFPVGAQKSKESAARRTRIYMILCGAACFVRAVMTGLEVAMLLVPADIFIELPLPPHIFDILTQVLILLPEMVLIGVMLLWMRYRSGSSIRGDVTSFLDDSVSPISSLERNLLQDGRAVPNIRV